MEGYDEYYDIRLAEISDIPDIMDFIEKEWRHNHILARDRAFFEYEHVIDGNVNFVIARVIETNIIDGILGFIPASNDKEHLDIWTVVWKTRPGCVPLLGLEIMNRIAHITNCRNLMGIGDNPKTTVPLLKKTDKSVKIFRLSHYYMLSDVDSFKIAHIRYRPDAKCFNNNLTEIRRLESSIHVRNYVDFNNYNVFPYKDEWYIEHRFFSHPINKYLVYGIRNDAKSALIVLRVQEYNDSRALRIVDFLGNQECFIGLYSFFFKLMRELKCEYTDFYVSGFCDEYIRKAGFSLINEKDTNVIPDYFNPFVCENIDIWADGKENNCLYCKADGDQDRPC